MNNLYNKPKNIQGFTLVELSIVLVIVGLLIGGALVGQSLSDSAKINTQIQQLQQYEIAFGQYFNKYKKLPGDHPRISSYNASTCSYCYAGNNDGFTAYNTFTGFNESLYAWKTLEQTGMIKTDKNYSGIWSGLIGWNDPTTIPLWAGKILPSSNFDNKIAIVPRAYFIGTESGGQINITYAPQCKTLFILGKPNTAYAGWGIDWLFSGGGFSGTEALNLDNKVDDGNAATGIVASTYKLPATTAGQECFTQGNVNTMNPATAKTYRTSNSDENACTLYYCLGSISGNIK